MSAAGSHGRGREVDIFINFSLVLEFPEVEFYRQNIQAFFGLL